MDEKERSRWTPSSRWSTSKHQYSHLVFVVCFLRKVLLRSLGRLQLAHLQKVIFVNRHSSQKLNFVLDLVMGRKGKGGAAAVQKRSNAAGSDSVLAAALAAGSGSSIRPLAPNKRNELSKMVEKLLDLTSNYSAEPSSEQALLEEHKKIRALLGQVMDLERTGNLNRPLVGSRLANAQAMHKWVEDAGGRIEGLRVVEKDGGLALQATEGIAAGKKVICVPRKCILSLDTARDSEIGRLVERDPMLRSMGNVALAMHLLMEKTNPASFWEPYVNALPSSYNTVLYFTEEELLQLRGSPSFEEALKQCKYVARQYAYFYEKFKGTMLKDYFTYEEYRWAVSTVMTRQNLIPSKYPDENGGASQTRFVNALVPLWDLANHSAEPSTLSTDFDDQAEEVICMANKTFAVEEEFTIFYGERGNRDLLHNGFAIADNQHDTLPIRLDAKLEAKQTELAETMGVSSREVYSLRRKEPLIEPKLMALARLLCLKEESKLDKWSEKGDDALLEADVEPELDADAYKYLMIKCSVTLRKYPTALEEDVKRLEESSLSANEKFCLHLRIGEKQILQEVIALCKQKLT